MKIDLLIHSASQLCTVPAENNNPQHGAALGTLGILENGAIAIHQGKILAVGATTDLQAQYQSDTEINASTYAIIPGLVDPHTHLVWAGDRAAEFEMRLAGASYMEIMAAGGGINNTVSKVRAASLDQLVAETRVRLDSLFQNGTTTVEIKTGYGLDTATEIKQLAAIYQLQANHPIDIIPTFLGAHAVPPEYKLNIDGYVDLLVNEMIPAVANFAAQQEQPMPFIDVFCETGAFDVAQSRRILTAGKQYGMRPKIHADEFKGLGGTKLAVELGAISADHLVQTPAEDIAALGRGDTIAVALPGTPFGLSHHDYTPARSILEAGGALALATDCNPGTSWCESMQFIMALACRMLKITPAEALAAATINAAFAIGKGGEIGSLEPGKKADLLILNVPDYRHLAYRFGGNLVKAIVKDGEVFLS